jgi:hypothetical protein
MGISDVNEFVDGYEHEAQLSGTIHFTQFEDLGDATFALDAANRRFHYLRINPATRVAEMNYHIEFLTHDGRRFLFDGTKYMKKDTKSGANAIANLLQDYTTLYCHVHEKMGDGDLRETGTAYMRFRTFEDLAAGASPLFWPRSRSRGRAIRWFSSRRACASWRLPHNSSSGNI